jgi:hypothetical protein
MDFYSICPEVSDNNSVTAAQQAVKVVDNSAPVNVHPPVPSVISRGFKLQLGARKLQI